MSRQSNFMRRALVLLLVVLGAASAFPAQSQWKIINPTPTTASLNPPVYGKGKYVIPGSYGSRNQAIVSSDGSNWESVEMPPASRGFGFTRYTATFSPASGFVLFPADLAYNSVFKSADGRSWTAVQSSSGLSLGLISDTDGNGMVVSNILQDSGLALSVDGGLNWKRINTSLYAMGIKYAAGEFLAWGPSNAGLVYSSKDGVNWGVRFNVSSFFSPDVLPTIGDIAGDGNGNYFALVSSTVGNSQAFFISSTNNGASWKATESLNGGATANIQYCFGQFVAAYCHYDANFQCSAQVLKSVNGKPNSWTTNPSPFGYHTITCANNQLFVTGDKGLIVQSTDAVSWKTHDEGIVDAIIHASFSEALQVYVVATPSNVYTSKYPNGPFTKVASDKYALFNKAGNNYAFVRDSRLFVTSDLIFWQDMGSVFPSSNQCNFRGQGPRYASISSNDAAYVVSGNCPSELQVAFFVVVGKNTPQSTATTLTIPDLPFQNNHASEIGGIATGRGVTVGVSSRGNGQTYVVLSRGLTSVDWVANIDDSNMNLFFLGEKDTGYFYALAGSGKVYGSVDGTKWDQVRSLTNVYSLGYLASEKKFVALTLGKIYSSLDGLNFTLENGSVNNYTWFTYLIDNARFPGQYLAVSADDSTIAYNTL